MRKILITGGAGFIGTNVTKYYLEKGDRVFIFDNLSRSGSKVNLNWLKSNYKKNLRFINGDVRNFDALKRAVVNKDIVFQFAAQVAVTTSVEHPRDDFEINALGTFNVLEAIRQKNPKTILLYSSTNKVYGGMEDEEVVEGKTRYSYKNLKQGVSETYPLDFHSPYGCSKGAADQYVRDYTRIYNLNTIVFRQSCIYGPHQFGVEDQGWVAWFIIAVLLGKKITIYGDGKQVRDVLYIDDLVHAFELAINNIGKTKGQVYNIGGGPEFSLSIWKEFEPILEEAIGKKIEVSYDSWRPGDQKIYISDIRKAKNDFGWTPKISPQKGIKLLVGWLKENKEEVRKVFLDND